MLVLTLVLSSLMNVEILVDLKNQKDHCIVSNFCLPYIAFPSKAYTWSESIGYTSKLDLTV